MIGNNRYIKITALTNWLSTIKRFNYCQLSCTFLHHPCNAKKIFASFFRRHFLQHILKCIPRRFHRPVYICRVCVSNFRKFFFIRRIDSVKIFFTQGLLKFSVYEQIVPRIYFCSRLAFRCWCVFTSTVELYFWGVFFCSNNYSPPPPTPSPQGERGAGKFI